MMWPPWEPQAGAERQRVLGLETLPPGRPVDRQVPLRERLFGLVAVSLVIAVGFLCWHLGRLTASTVVRWQIELIDSTNEAPPLPHLPASPFAQ